jgi:DNA-binding transcriptional LysR family regulator
MTVSLPQMRGFTVLAKHLSFKRAAVELGITQPALSSQITALERLLGAQLLVRTTRSARLTPAGESFLRRSRRILSDVDSAVSELRNPSSLQQGIVSFSCIPTIAGEMFPRIIRQYRRRQPDVTIEMVDEETVAMEQRIVNREVDFGVGGVPRRDDLSFTQIFADPFVLVCNREHPLARKDRISIEEALKHPVISLAKESNVRQTINAYVASRGLIFSPAYDLLHHYTIGAMVQAGLGSTFLPSQATVLLKMSRHLKIIPFTEPEFARPVGLITRRDEMLSLIADDFCSFTLKSMSTMAPSKSAKGGGRAKRPVPGRPHRKAS